MIQFASPGRRAPGLTTTRLATTGLMITALAAVLLAMAQGFAAAAPARAAAGSSVYLVETRGEKVLWFKDAAGVANDVTISVEASGAKVVDSAGPLVAGAGCVNADAHTVTCANASPVQQIYLGGGDDRVLDHGSAGRTAVHYVYGEQGDDVIRDLATDGRVYGGPGNDTLDIRGSRTSALGGPGNDWLDGRKGYEVWLWGDEGNDVLMSGASGKLYGGDGDDWLDGLNPTRPNGALLCDGGTGANLLENCPV
ncbi:hypothetical protein [Actinomadura roseirufa]|uniref:hypothetical protein n=1 Tax=Actinomadura roseirufa TaxID=2094049 RepID=UPI0010412B62|nr:hypothetical protein [Actinomadura roseirufa]